MITPRRRTFLGTVVAATVAVTCLATASAQGATASGGDGVRKVSSASAVHSRGPAADQGLQTKAVPASTTAALASVQSNIARYVTTHGTKYSFASYVDPATGRIVLDTDAPAGVVASVKSLRAAPLATQRAAQQVRVERTKVSDTFNRRDDSPPFYGGGGLTASGFLCSSGAPVRNAAGTVFMTTAGHCFGNGVSVLTESGARTYGTVSNRHLPTVTGDAKDVELMSGQSYAGRIFTGGITSTSSSRIYGAGDAVRGFANYCHSGRTTGEQCGHTATSTNAQVCTASGCKSPVIAFTGGTMIQGGDSGGTFYVYSVDRTGIYVRGHVIASGGSTGYAEPWSGVSSTLGVSVVTS
jgi:hypothetical protein